MSLESLAMCAQQVADTLDMSPGAVAILRERIRQIEEEGYSIEHDVKDNDPFVLIKAALAYLKCADGDNAAGFFLWPWRLPLFRPSTRIRNLEKAGALIAAAIDLIHAKEEKNNDKMKSV